ncbi:MAG: response regulator, partial [bacterium]|nr:response regulator [bacterium]
MIAAARPTPLALIVDDAPDIRLTLTALAKRHGYEVVTAENGVQGLALAQERRPDLILLDIEMPEMDGLTLLGEIREYDASVAVVIISSSSDEEKLEEALELGAINFVHKPFDHKELDFVLDQVYRTTEEAAHVLEVLGLVTSRTTGLTMPNNPRLLSKVVAYLARELCNQYPNYEFPLTEIKLALYESLANALEHGNLEITYAEKTQAMESKEGIHGLIAARLAEARLASRQIHIQVSYEAEQAVYAVRDEGPGFDPKPVIERGVADTSALHGRGITLIRH